MKVLLIEPKGHDIMLNAGLGYLASYLLSQGHEVKVIDLNIRREKEKERLDYGLRWKPRVIGFSITTFSLNEVRRLVKYCKQKYDAVYVAGGCHVTIQREEFMERNRDLFDYAIVGEGEHTLAELLQNLADPKDVRGIIYPEAGKVVKTEDRPLIEDLDSLPFPAYHLFDSYDSSKGIDWYPIITSRGCPYDCVFCLVSRLYRRKWRARSPENVVDEIKRVIKDYGCRKFCVYDDAFTLDLERVKKICDLIISEGLNIEFRLTNGTRAAPFDIELAEKLKKSGCTLIGLGIEDGDPETFSYVNKGETLEDIKRAVSIIKKVGIEVRGFMIIGLIGTTYKSFLNSLRFSQELGVRVQWYLPIPFPHTKLYDWTKKNGTLLVDVSDGLEPQARVFFETPEFKREERLKAYYLANLRHGNYEYLFIERENQSRAFALLSIAWKYDKRQIPHLIINFIHGALCQAQMSLRRHFI